MMYVIGRYRLNFTDDEFWNATPCKLWAIYKAVAKTEENAIENIEEATAANLFV